MRKVLVVVLLVHLTFVAWNGYSHSPVQSEDAHLASGVSHYFLRRFDLYCVNPPLVRWVCALPIVLIGPNTCWDHYRVDFDKRSEFAVGKDFQRVNQEHILWYMILARWMCLPFAGVGATICWLWAQRLYGRASGIAAVLMWSFCPYVLGHCATIIPDAHATAVGVSCWYAFWVWLKTHEWRDGLCTGVLLGLAVIAKFTLLIFYPLIPIVWLLYRWQDRFEMHRKEWVRQSLIIVAAISVSIVIINVGYLFEGTLKKVRDYDFQSAMFTGANTSGEASHRKRNRFIGTWIEGIQLPVPSNFIQGVDTQRADFEHGLPSFLFGKWRDGGWWYYYLYALAIKLPLGFLLMIALSCFVSVFVSGFSASARDELVLLAPAIAIFVLLCWQSGISVHSRYAIPILPFVFVWSSKVARAFQLGHRRLAKTAILALTWMVCSSIWVFPHSIAYFNELVGGPANGHEYLLESNIDWGQDLRYLKSWIDSNPNAKPLSVDCFGSFDRRILGIGNKLPPNGHSLEDANSDIDEVGPIPGWYAVSVSLIGDRSQKYSYFLQFKPIRLIGYSIHIYHITVDEVNQARRRLGLPIQLDRN